MYINLVLHTCFLISFFLNSYGQALFENMKIPARHKQIILVKAAGWDSQTAILQRYQTSENQWRPIGNKIEVNLGKNGLGWGRGLHILGLQGPEKIEGDGKAPAGIFEFGDAFGYDDKPPANIAIPYRHSTSRDYWVDAANSPDYNSWVTITEDKLNDPKKYWRSFEKMKRADHLYELGLVVKHNMDPVVAEKGSAIFFHIWREAGAPTSGCTSMSKEDLKTLLKWLDPEKNPLLIQVPTSELTKVSYFAD